MAGPGSPTTEQQVILDADGRPVLSVMQQVEGHLRTIQNQVKDIAGISGKMTADVDKQLRTTVKDLQISMGQLRTMAQAGGTPGFKIQALNANRGLAQQTVQATDYARTIGMARNAVEGLQGKINDLNREIAGRGASGQAATIAQRDRLLQYQQQLAALKALEAQQDRTQRRLAGSKGGDLTAELRALEQAQARLSSAAMNPNRYAITREIKAAQLAQDQLTEAINRTRTAQASLIREQRAQSRDLVGREVRTMAQGGQIGTVLPGLQMQRQLAEDRLAAATGEQIGPAREALALAEKRVQVAQRMANLEQQEAEALQRQNALVATRNRLEEEAAARVQGKSRVQIAVGEAAALREVDAVQRAMVLNADRIRNARAQLPTASIAMQKQLQEEIQLEKAVGAQLRTNLAEINREIAAKAKLNSENGGGGGAAAGGAGGGAGGLFNSVLPKGGLPTVFARTAAYALAGGSLFAAIGTLREGAQFTLEFEDALHKLQAISGATDGTMVQLKETITNVGESSRFSLLDLTEMATKLAQAGVSANGMHEALQSVATLATASGSTPQEAVDLVTAALGSFQLAADEAPRIADTITTALNRTRLTVQQAALAIQYVGATAHEQNISLDQLLATTAALSQAGIRSGSTIGTGMRQFLVDLQTPSKDLTEQFERLHISMDDVDVSTRGLPAVLDTLSQKGFGASQAYGALETRAAAFYLTARSNTGLMNELQVEFANAGAAADAQAKAMDSVAAQWGRFKNILGEGFAESADGIMTVFQNLLRQISDHLIEARKLADQTAQAQAQGPSAYGSGIGGKLGYAMNYNLAPALETGAGAVTERIGNMLWSGGAGTQGKYSGYGGLGTWIVELGNNVNDLTGRIAGLDTKMQTNRDTTATYEDRVRSLDHEIGRLVQQKESLAKQTGAVSAETATLSSRFEGLSAQLLGTSNSVDGLIAAMRRLRNQEAGLLIESIQGEIATANQLIGEHTGNRRANIASLRADPATMKLLNKSEQNALAMLDRPNVTEDQRRTAAGVLSDRLSIWTREGRTDAVNKLAPVITANAGVATNQGIVQRDTVRMGDVDFSRSPIGQDIRSSFESIDALVHQLSTATDATKPAIQKQIKDILDPLEATIKHNVAGVPTTSTGPNYRNQMAALGEIASYRQSVIAATTPTKSEQAAADREQRRKDAEAARVERQRELDINQPKVTDADVARIMERLFAGFMPGGTNGRIGAITTAGRELIGQGFRVNENRHISGRNGVETAPVYTDGIHKMVGHGDNAIDVNADKNEISRLNQVAADYQKRGYRILWLGKIWEPNGSGPGRNIPQGADQHMDHLHMEAPPAMAMTGTRGGSGTAAQALANMTPEQGARAARQMENALKQIGIQGSQVTFEGGRLKVKLPENARFSSAADRDGSQTSGQVDLATLRLDTAAADRNLREKLKDLRHATSKEVFATGEQAANDAFEAWANSLRLQTEEDIANQGNMTASQAAERRQAVEDQIQQRLDEMNNNIFDSILKNIDAVMKQIEHKFDTALKPAQDQLAASQSQVEGLGYESLRGKVPDYVAALAQHRVASAQENVVRTRASLLPGRIEATQNALSAAQADIAGRSLTDPQMEAATEKVRSLTEALAALKTEKVGLDEALGAGGLIPTTLSEGLDQAIQAFRLANNVGTTFKEDVIMNLGGAIQTLSDGFTTMFENIANGTQTVLGAFRQFVTDMIKYMIQLAIKAAALKIFNLLLNVAASAAGGGGTGQASDYGSMPTTGAIGMFTGGTPPIGADGLVRLAGGGGRVMNGSPARDSVNAKIARDEWVVQSKAVRSVGHPFMAKLNAEGASALDALRAAPVIVPQAPQETNVWVVKPDTPRPLGKNDILVAVQDDILSGGETKKLIKHVANGN